MVSFFRSVIFLLSLLPLIATGLPSPRHFSALKPAYFLLAGDSTTATQSVGGGGWGDGFLNFTLKQGSSGHNYGHNGATTKSFREGGDWDRLMTEAKTKMANYTVYVTIQFGHNDQKATSGVNLTQYTNNLIAFAREVSSIGAIPVCHSPRIQLSAMPSDIYIPDPRHILDPPQIHHYHSTNHHPRPRRPTQSHYRRCSYNSLQVH
jgi:hypothetical protein